MTKYLLHSIGLLHDHIGLIYMFVFILVSINNDIGSPVFSFLLLYINLMSQGGFVESTRYNKVAKISKIIHK